jgi:hypothetical protein
MSTTATLQNDYNILTTMFCEELKSQSARLCAEPTPQNPHVIATQESQFHIKSHENNDILAKQPLHTLLPPTYKLLTDRTLDHLYETIFERFMIMYPDRATQISNHILALGLNKWLKVMILTSPEVSQFMMPIVLDLMVQVEKEIKRLDDIPYVEQKTQEWLRIRADMISASVAGYFDAAECGCGMSKEYGQIREKSGLQAKKSTNNWAVASLRHGQTFEDLSGALYNIFNDVSSKEYGILPDVRHPCIGASPDGIIIDVADRNNWLNLRKLGRMREIKNPTSRLINQKVPDTYYWQMIQQMYVCQLPLCDFIQTSFSYPNTSTHGAFLQDTLDTRPVLSAESWQALTNALKPLEYADEEYATNSMTDSVLLDKLDWLQIINGIGREAILTQHTIPNLNRVIAKYVVSNWDSVSKIPLSNINRSGDIKGILWCFTKPDTLGGTDFEVLFMEPNKPINSVEQINQFYIDHSAPILQRGFALETTYYWACKKYLDFEVEYNQYLYESHETGILSRLLKKWDLVQSIRNAPDSETKESLYMAFYPAASKEKKSTSSLNCEDKKTWGYTKKIKKITSSGPIQDVFNEPELDLS